MKKMDNFGGPTVINKITLEIVSREWNHFLEIFCKRWSNRDLKRFEVLENVGDKGSHCLQQPSPTLMYLNKVWWSMQKFTKILSPPFRFLSPKIFGELLSPTTQFLFRLEISQKWQRHLKRQKMPRQRLPLEAVKSQKRSGPRAKPGTNFQICAFSTNQPTTKFLKKFQTIRFWARLWPQLTSIWI